jgi:hypothetical protein
MTETSKQKLVLKKDDNSSKNTNFLDHYDNLQGKISGRGASTIANSKVPFN